MDADQTNLESLVRPAQSVTPGTRGSRAAYTRTTHRGARIDRLARSSRTGKERVYAFRSKDELYRFVAPSMGDSGIGCYETAGEEFTAGRRQAGTVLVAVQLRIPSGLNHDCRMSTGPAQTTLLTAENPSRARYPPGHQLQRVLRAEQRTAPHLCRWRNLACSCDVA